jgi:hypothetical protein
METTIDNTVESIFFRKSTSIKRDTDGKWFRN